MFPQNNHKTTIIGILIGLSIMIFSILLYTKTINVEDWIKLMGTVIGGFTALGFILSADSSKPKNNE